MNHGQVEQIDAPDRALRLSEDALRRRLHRHVQPARPVRSRDARRHRHRHVAVPDLGAVTRDRTATASAAGAQGAVALRPEKVRIARAAEPPPRRQPLRRAPSTELPLQGDVTVYIVDTAGRPQDRGAARRIPRPAAPSSSRSATRVEMSWPRRRRSYRQSRAMNAIARARAEGRSGKWLVSGPPLALPDRLLRRCRRSSWCWRRFARPANSAASRRSFDASGSLDLNLESYARFFGEPIYAKIFLKSFWYALLTTLALPRARLSARALIARSTASVPRPPAAARDPARSGATS